MALNMCQRFPKIAPMNPASSHLSRFVGLMALALVACQPQTQSQPVNQPETRGSGYVAEVQALGMHFGGVPSTDWRLYETIHYDSAGREVEKVTHWDGFGTQTRTQYDTKGRIVKMSRVSGDRTGNIDYTTSWSENGLESVLEEYAHNEKKVVSRVTKRLREDGKVLEEVTENLQFAEVGIDSQRVVCKYDANGFLVLKEEHFQGKVIPGTRYTNDSAGNPIQFDQSDSDGNVTETTYQEFDGNGKILRVFSKEAAAPEKELRRSNKWNSEGLLLETHTYIGNCSESGLSNGKCPIVQTIRYTFDTQGRILSMDTFLSGQSTASTRLKYTYKPFAH
jgi:hypothetical protein